MAFAQADNLVVHADGRGQSGINGIIGSKSACLLCKSLYRPTLRLSMATAEAMRGWIVLLAAAHLAQHSPCGYFGQGDPQAALGGGISCLIAWQACFNSAVSAAVSDLPSLSWECLYFEQADPQTGHG